MQVTVTANGIVTAQMNISELYTLCVALSLYASQQRTKSAHIAIDFDRFAAMQEASQANTMLLVATNPTYTD